MAYVDGFIVVVPKNKVDAYKRLARKAGKLWKKYGALEFKECIADDVKKGKLTSFPRSVKKKPNETVFFSYIVYKSRKDRDRINAKVMKDPRIAGMDMKDMPFDARRMIYTAASRSPSTSRGCRAPPLTKTAPRWNRYGSRAFCHVDSLETGSPMLIDTDVFVVWAHRGAESVFGPASNPVRLNGALLCFKTEAKARAERDRLNSRSGSSHVRYSVRPFHVQLEVPGAIANKTGASPAHAARPHAA
jgi:uncharacterized protein YbaA (DUF1428 family)